MEARTRWRGQAFCRDGPGRTPILGASNPRFSRRISSPAPSTLATDTTMAQRSVDRSMVDCVYFLKGTCTKVRTAAPFASHCVFCPAAQSSVPLFPTILPRPRRAHRASSATMRPPGRRSRLAQLPRATFGPRPNARGPTASSFILPPRPRRRRRRRPRRQRPRAQRTRPSRRRAPRARLAISLHWARAPRAIRARTATSLPRLTCRTTGAVVPGRARAAMEEATALPWTWTTATGTGTPAR